MRHAIVLGLTILLGSLPAHAEEFSANPGVRAELSFGGSTPGAFSLNGVRIAGGPDAMPIARAVGETSPGERIAMRSILITAAAVVAASAAANYIFGEVFGDAVEATFTPQPEEEGTASTDCSVNVAGQCVGGGG